MSTEAIRWREVKRVFDEAARLEGQARADYLRSEHAASPDVVADVESLLEWDAQTGSPLDAGLAGLASVVADGHEEALVGTLVGAWRIVGVIGRGGMGVVYRAERADEAFHMPAAVKVMRRMPDSSKVVRRFYQERETLAALDHPNIARLLDGGTTANGQPYLVMELVEGVPIDRYCDERQLTIDERLALFTTVCAAVEYAHQNLVVHRDIKPDNILVTNDGTPKLLDFGVARLLNTSEATAEDVPTTWLLTPDYASPEQLRGGAFTTATDVYSLGVLLYFLLTGRRPYERSGSSLEAIQAGLTAAEPPRPSQTMKETAEDAAARAGRRQSTPHALRARLRGDLDAIVRKALAHTPAARYRSVEQLAADLARHERHHPVVARGAAMGYVVGRFVRRHRVWLGVASAVLILAASSVVAIVRQASLTAEARARAERRFNDVRRLAQAFMFDVHDAIVNVPGTTAARAVMVRTAITYLDGLSTEAASDRSLQRELAAAFVKVGDAQGHPTSANLGDTAGARVSYLRAIALAGGLLASDPDDAVARRTLAQAHRRLGDVLGWSGNPASALTHALDSRRLLIELGRRPGASVDDRLQAAIADIKVGDLLGNPNLPNVNRPGEADVEYARALDALRVLARDAPTPPVRRYLALVLERRGTLFEAAAQLADAERVYRESFDIRSALAASVRNHGDIQRDFAIAFEKLGNVRGATGDRDGAIGNYRGALAQFERLAQSDPSNAIAARSVAISRQKLAGVLTRPSERDEAVGLLRAAAATHRRLAQRDPENAQARCDFVRVNEELADAVSARTQATPAACELWRESHEWAEELKAAGDTACLGGNDIGRLANKLSPCPQPVQTRIAGSALAR
jgi:non-specific serine/threonine protein kinase/serine/threonine-protein kinase